MRLLIATAGVLAVFDVDCLSFCVCRFDMLNVFVQLKEVAGATLRGQWRPSGSAQTRTFCWGAMGCLEEEEATMLRSG